MKLIFKIACILSIFAIASFSKSPLINVERYKPGYYIDDSGKTEGYIYFAFDNYQKFNFKADPDGKKVVKRADDCKGFFVDGKTFTVITNVDLKIGIWNLYAEKAFAEVISEGDVNLYKIYSMVGNGNMHSPGVNYVINYILQKKGSRDYVLATLSKSKFKSAMTEYFKDRADIVEKINDGTYSSKNIEELVSDYNHKSL